MIRIARPEDAGQLEELNRCFNGAGETTLQHVRASLRDNPQEVVFVADEKTVLAGFLCLQIRKSFCYDDCMPEITELYVRPQYRRRGIAFSLLEAAEKHCRDNLSCSVLELLTGEDNPAAQSLYRKFGFRPDGEIHLSRPVGQDGSVPESSGPQA